MSVELGKQQLVTSYPIFGTLPNLTDSNKCLCNGAFVSIILLLSMLASCGHSS
jgi:hypothetical protein